MGVIRRMERRAAPRAHLPYPHRSVRRHNDGSGGVDMRRWVVGLFAVLVVGRNVGDAFTGNV